MFVALLVRPISGATLAAALFAVVSGTLGACAEREPLTPADQLAYDLQSCQETSPSGSARARTEACQDRARRRYAETDGASAGPPPPIDTVHAPP
jgi:hypothetical protein